MVREWEKHLAEKIGGPHAIQIAQLDLKEVAPEIQMESHTCGLHTLRTIYSAFGLNPDLENLRFRLGVDRPANPLDPESIGTLQPDMFRVLLQDGFEFERLVVSKPNVNEELVKALKNNKLAAALIRRRQNGNLHWVVLRSESDSKVTVIDSLEAKPYSEPLPGFIDECLLSCILVAPAAAPDTEVSEGDIEWAHMEGSWEMVESVKRYKLLNVRN
ncbi:MAG: hypothetical protein IT366_23890 [Candidatus Hydrogenedentes bacterium]|nr:hypothetical protein [Candidatus Hydrogenedentota bacterium]